MYITRNIRSTISLGIEQYLGFGCRHKHDTTVAVNYHQEIIPVENVVKFEW